MDLPIAQAGFDGSELLSPRRSRGRRTYRAPWIKRYSVLWHLGGDDIADLNILWCTRRYWDRRRDDGRKWAVLDIGPFFVIAVTVLR